MTPTPAAPPSPEPGAAPYRRVHEDLLAPVGRVGRRYLAAVGFLAALLAAGAGAWALQLLRGLQVTGLNHPAGWGIYITSFVFWIGIAHSGTLISAILYLFRASWRPAISRASEAMTVFAVMTAGLFPLVHLGRVWRFYYLIPYPNQRHLWPNFRSPLLWDVFAVGTYLTVSALFLYLGLIPDLAALRDRSRGWRRRLYGALSLGWGGTASQWHHYRSLYLFFAALATPLVVSVHSVVSWDFAMSLLPGWHTTIFAPYFVSGAIFSGLAMVLTLVIPLRRWLGLQRYITVRHLEGVAKLLLTTSLIISYSYAVEFWMSWLGGDPVEASLYRFRAVGPYMPLFAVMLVCNSLLPLSLFWRRARTSVPWLFALALLVNVGMWVERFWIITSSLVHDFDPAAWGSYRGSPVEATIFAGSLALFLLLFLLFIRSVPPVPIAEVKEASGGGASREAPP